jgi:DNA-binding response OmpR family regulator
MRILLVAHDVDLCRIAIPALHAARLMVDAVGDAREGLGLATTNLYDLVIVDLGRPGMSGRGLTRRVRQANGTVPIVAVTDLALDAAARLQLGVNACLVKPITPAELLGCVNGLLERDPIQ